VLLTNGQSRYIVTYYTNLAYSSGLYQLSHGLTAGEYVQLNLIRIENSLMVSKQPAVVNQERSI